MVVGALECPPADSLTFTVRWDCDVTRFDFPVYFKNM